MGNYRAKKYSSWYSDPNAYPTKEDPKELQEMQKKIEFQKEKQDAYEVNEGMNALEKWNNNGGILTSYHSQFQKLKFSDDVVKRLL
ncbi:hypothetical protein HDU97_001154 [Phlyctochytrium planicorne]|nr:hypothetical protein HDU97_001154 [Phlyctochytrium planicorne]